MRTKIMRDASYLLPPPGGEVVRDLLDSYDALLARHNALREAVAWERECIRQLDYVGKFWEDDNVPGRELIMILDAARAEVDRLLEEK